jgi:hypothetical protein
MSDALSLPARLTAATLDGIENCRRDRSNCRVPSADYCSPSVGEVFFRLASSERARHARSLFSDPQSNLCQCWRDVAWIDRGPPSVLVDPSFSRDALRPSISFGPRGKSPTREVRTNISRLPKADMVLIMGLGMGPIPVGDANHLTAQKRTRFGIGIAFRLYYRQPGHNSKNGSARPISDCCLWLLLRAGSVQLLGVFRSGGSGNPAAVGAQPTRRFSP